MVIAHPGSRMPGRRSPVTTFNVSRRGLSLIALIAIALFVVGIATSVGLFGWAVAIILGVYVVVMLIRGLRS